MEEPAVTMKVWGREDPLEAVANEVFAKISELMSCTREEGGEDFVVFVDGQETSHEAHVSFYLRKMKKPGKRLERIRQMLTARPYVLAPLKRAWQWTTSIHSGQLLVSMCREPLPTCLVEEYTLYVRIENCPEIEGPIAEICAGHREKFGGGIYIYSEREMVLPDSGEQPEGAQGATS
jgi:hypothetical protein